jgi:Ala-tRNA(Pro) deacylase
MNTTLREMLLREGVPFKMIDHREVFTAQRRAAACHYSGRLVAKVVVVRDPRDDWHALAVLPASAYLDIMALRDLTGRPELRLADEAEFARLFPDCEVGAVPPFGRVYGGLDVFLDPSLSAAGELVFCGGTHHEEVRIPMDEYLRIERPEVVPLAVTLQAA